MANTYTQLYIQFVFAVQNRGGLIQPQWEDELYKYITGIVRNHNHKMIAINGIEDHVHLFVGLHPTQSISDLMKFVKGDSSEWINQKKLVKEKFQWQKGYGAFSYSRRQIDSVYRYIMDQKEHHKKISLQNEYREYLKEFEILYDEKFIFKSIL